MKKLIAFFFGPKLPEKPLDLSNYEEARGKLHKTIRATTKELDAFGDMVRDMRGLKPLKKRNRK